MADEKLEQLKLKYQSVLNLMTQLGVQLQNLHVQDGKLVIRGNAKTRVDSNKVWNQIKLVDAAYEADLLAQLTFDAEGAPAVAPAPAARPPARTPSRAATPCPPLPSSSTARPASIGRSSRPTATSCRIPTRSSLVRCSRSPAEKGATMGLLDGLLKDALGSALGNVLGGGKTAPAAPGGPAPAGGLQGLQLAQLALQLLQQVGGLQGLMNMFNKAGLADQLKSWISTGSNQPVSPSQLAQVLGPDMLSKLGAQVGLDSAQVSSGLAQVLPSVVDQLTPAGQVPDNQQDLVNDGLKLLLSKLG